MFSNCSTSSRRPATFTVYWKFWVAGPGGIPTCPAGTWRFCCWTALTTSLGEMLSDLSVSGFIQTRMLYWPMPKMFTSPTPGSRASTSLRLIQA
jgi:hypothetical protein